MDRLSDKSSLGGMGEMSPETKREQNRLASVHKPKKRETKPKRIWASAGYGWVEEFPGEQMQPHETLYIRADTIADEITAAFCRGYNKAVADAAPLMHREPPKPS